MKLVYVVIDEAGDISEVFLYKKTAEKFVEDWRKSYPARLYIEEYPLDETQE